MIRANPPNPRHPRSILLFLACALLLIAGCTPSAQSNVLAYLAAQHLGTLGADAAPGGPAGTLTGLVTHAGRPLPGASVVVAERYGTPHAAQTGPDGRYRIEGIPPGEYVPAATAPGYEEAVARDLLGTPRLVSVEAGRTTAAPPIELTQHMPRPLPSPLAAAVELTSTGVYTAAANFPPGAAAQVESFAFTFDGVTVDTLRLVLPLNLPPDAQLPLLFLVYPSPVDNWEPISVAFAAQGYAVLAISPAAARGMDIDAHAQDARVAFNLAREGALGPHIADGQAVALGGSFSSPILRRFLRDEGDGIAAWITLGGISDAYRGAAEFYAGKLDVPPQYALAVPALGLPNLYPLPFLRYSPVYAAAELPPTMVIHTAADHVTPIDQAYRLEAALHAAGVPTEAFYYEDVSHYLQIGDDLTAAGAEMFDRILDFVAKYLPPAPVASLTD